MRRLGLLGLALLVAGCDGADDRFLLSVEGSGEIQGIAFLDLNRDGVRGTGEARLPGLQVTFLPVGSQTPVSQATSGNEGEFSASNLSAGRYRVEVPAGGVLGDSLEVTSISPEQVQLAVNGAAEVEVGVSFPVRSIRETLQGAPGTRSYVEGIVLNQRGSIPGNTIHVWDGDRAIRVPEVATFPHAPGDTVRILGRVERPEGQDRAVLGSAQGFRLGQSETPPTPIELSAQQARSAGQGELDAALIRVEGASVTDVRTADGTVLATANDGSGPVQARIPQAHLTAAGIPVLEVGAILSVTGLLQPREGSPGTWEIRTRSRGDLEVVAQGIIEGLAFFDVDGGGQANPSDPRLPGVRIQIFRTGDDTAPVTEVETGTDGRFRSGVLDVSTYRLVVDAATIPDSLVVREITPSPVQVSTGGVTQVQIAISHPRVTSAEARDLPDGRTVFLHGTALNGRAALGDGSVHVRGPAGALRMTGVTQTVLPGDRVRMRGRTATVAGQRVLTDVTPFIESEGGVPAPLIIPSAQAATAGGGPLDADLVRIREVTIQSASPVDEDEPGRWIVVVSDGSGPVEVDLRLGAVGIPLEEAEEILTVGQSLTVTGLLIPFRTPEDTVDNGGEETSGTTGWRVTPRIPADFTRLDL